MKKQQARIMNEEEFALYYEEMKEQVEEWKAEYDRGEVQHALIGWLGAEREYAFTGEQLKRLFDLCF